MPLGGRFDEALAYVCSLHRDHIRKGTDRNAAGEPVAGTPYVSHLLAVASLVLEAGGDEDEAIAALCHDAIEDQPRDGATECEILEMFGVDVLEIVKGCTKRPVDETLSPEQQRDQRRAMRAEYFEHLRGADRSVALVSAADKLHNARAIVADLRELSATVWGRFSDNAAGTLWYYSGVAGALSSRGDLPARLVGELARTVEEMHRLGAGG